MASVNDLIQEVSEQTGDVELERITKEQVLVLLNSAARDLGFAGIITGITDNESLSASSGGLIVVPSDFCYIHDIWGGTSFTTWIPHNHWSFQIVSSAPNILFDSEQQDISAGSVQLNGHRRPTNTYTLGSGTVDVGFEAFLRSRTVAYAAQQLAQIADGAAASNLEGISSKGMQSSNEMMTLLANQAHFRPQIYSRAVPLR